MSRAPALLLLDRDGVILRHVEPYILDPRDIEFLPGALEAIATFSKAGTVVMVVTNQSPVGRRLVSESFVAETNELISREVEKIGGRISRFFVCSHTPADKCACRKPSPALLLAAASAAGVDPVDAWMVGDQPSDILAAFWAGCLERIQLTCGKRSGVSEIATRHSDSLRTLAAAL